jgi:hypothetical protein
MSAFDSTFSSAFSLFDEAFASGVTYTRGEDSLSVQAMDAQISNDEQIEFNANMIAEGWVFQIKKADLILDSVVVEPASLDTITNAAGVWEVCNFGQLPDYETDVNSEYWRIRTIKKS